MAKKPKKGKFHLMIVESPAKARTLEKFLGKEFIVRHSMGHIRDLPTNEFGVDVEKNYEPTYVIAKGKEQIVRELKKLTQQAKDVWLATDEDREGEAISWHLCQPLNIDVRKAKRVVFHEITKPTVLEALKHPRTINLDLVYAQQARRVLDRLVGYELSPILWRKIPGKGNLSAGRVQSVAVRLIVEREREINAFQPTLFYRVHGLFRAPGIDNQPMRFKAELATTFAEREQAEKFLKACIGATFQVARVQVKPARRSPAAPFTTSTLQQEASRKLGFSVSRTMRVAQQLYENGKITYMRTDSTSLSSIAIEAIEKEIKRTFGANYASPRQYKNKIINAQEAHEAIRPTDITQRTVEGTDDEKKLYQLIWKRTVASQMSDARIEKTTVDIAISTRANEALTATGEVLQFDGFLKVYHETTDEEAAEDQSSERLPPLKKNQILTLIELQAVQRFSRPQPRYTEASLVKKLEELGIGRPSTYAPTIQTILKRGYVEIRDREGTPRSYEVLALQNDKVESVWKSEVVGAERAKLVPTDKGIITNDFLMQHFREILDYQFTADIEKEFDEIALGKKKWNKVVDVFYKPFHQSVLKTLSTAQRATGERRLGTDPQTGKVVLARMGRYGPMVQLGLPTDPDKPRFVRLKGKHTIESITLEEALALFRLPRQLGSYEGKEVVVGEGRFGPYVLHDGKFYSLKGQYDPLSITLEEAIQVMQTKRENIIKEFKKDNMVILRGAFGPYIKHGALNVRIPKDMDPASLTLQQCRELVAKASEQPRPKRKRSTLNMP